MGCRSIAAKLYRSFVREQHNAYCRRIRYNFRNPNAYPAASIARSDAFSAHVNRNVGSNQQGLLCIRKDRICLFVVRGIRSSDLRQPRAIHKVDFESKSQTSTPRQVRKSIQRNPLLKDICHPPPTSVGHHFSYLPFSLINPHPSSTIHTIHHLSVLRYQSISNRQCLLIISTR